MRLSLIVAMAENRAIGKDNALPWRLPADLRRFRRLTTGHPVIMGRRSYESIGRPLPERTNIVVTRHPEYQADGCLIAHTLEQALSLAQGAREIFVIGGAEIYAQTLERADKIYLTLVHAEVPGDTFFPTFDMSAWRETEREAHTVDDKHTYRYSFVTLERSVPERIA
jgi:dihydrofolate reductase